ncbi:MAG: histidine kinase, partial [Marinilabiliales bacterium]
MITLIVCGFHFTSAQPVKEMGNPFIHNFSPSEYKGGAQNWSFEQDNCGRIFVGNNSGILVYDGLNWHLERISNHSVVYSLAKDSLGTIYAGAAGDFGYMAVNSAGRIRYQSLIPKLSEENKKSFTIIWYTVA